MEIGSFIGLDLNEFGEYYEGARNIARLNSARAGIYHSCRLYNCKSIYIPYYLCPVVNNFLSDFAIKAVPYTINKYFEPDNLVQQKDFAVLLVNYFGILSFERIRRLAKQYTNVIIDNSAAFFSKPVEGCCNVYSTRKFFGVPDGCYVIGNDADRFTDEYCQDFATETSSFLFGRHEHGVAATYGERMKNEKRIDNAGIRKMSLLTNTLLKSIDYPAIMKKRRNNFLLAHALYQNINKIDPSIFLDNNCVPMIYPLVIEDESLNEVLKVNKVYTGRWWKHVLSQVDAGSFEAWLSKFMIPIPIDQQYCDDEIKFVYEIIRNNYFC